MLSRESSHEWDATSYHQVSQPQFLWGQRVLDRLSLRGDETVLDAGCGSGRLTAKLLERLPQGRVIAVDRSENMLEVARAFLLPQFGDRVQFLRADLEHLPLNEAVDCIFSTATFHWILDHRSLFQHLFHVLKPGGVLVAQCGGGPNLARLLQRAALLLEAPPYAPFFLGWSDPWEFADDLTTAARLRDTGFTEIETSLESTPTAFATSQEYREFLTTVNFFQHLERIPNESLRLQFIARLIEQAEKDTPPLVLDYWRLNLRGTRPGVL
jgi:trans-aconitate 2-methyltransferase